ncbi:YcgL domain-containing protein [Teredinibacter haidensis]|uniref:YcgL domain-containing protein n=1 Tax=Teredinibacter haidensis TaxID=2731755 RepID=UPI000948BB38|nr:YcgL domain-containing protein [Teredinibacter haidensis]
MMLLTDIYRSKKKEGMYLYVRKGYSLKQLPEALQKQFGQAELAMSLLLTKEKKLARADVESVIESIEKQDFYLQLPPSIILGDNYMQKIPNAKMGRG